MIIKKRIRPLLLAASLATTGVFPLVASDANLPAAVAPHYLPVAREIADHGGFQGFHAAPGCVWEPSAPLYDFLVQNVCVDGQGQVTTDSPLTLKPQRDVRAGEALPYYLSDYPRAGEPPSARQRRYSVPFAEGTDQTGRSYPIILSWRDLTPDTESREYGTFGARDIASMIGIFPDFGCYLGAFIPKKPGYVVSVGPGYADEAVEGMARFAHALYPARIPPLGARWYASILQKTCSVGRRDQVDAFPAHATRLLVPQLTIGERLKYVFGTRAHPTPALDTVVVVLAYNNVNALGDAPQVDNPSSQTERIYLTRELGYATRWESWARADSRQKDVLAAARRAYDYDNCGVPASLAGEFSEHFILGPVHDDAARRVYWQDQTIIDPATGRREMSTWYMIGCHDYTNVQPAKPFDPGTRVNPATVGADYLRLFGVGSPASVGGG